MAPGRGLGQPGVDANAVAGAADAALEQVTGIQQASDLGRRGIRALEREARRFGDDEQVRESAECRNDVLGDSVAEVILVAIVGEILERQDRDRWAPR
jgi:hypothetical protein